MRCSALLRVEDMQNKITGRKLDIVAVDFDGTLTGSSYPNMVDADTELIDLLLKFKELGGKVILWTSRIGKPLKDAINWCDTVFGLTFDAVNDSLQESKDWLYKTFGDTYSRKIFADLFIDDLSFNVPIAKEMLRNRISELS